MESQSNQCDTSSKGFFIEHDFVMPMKWLAFKNCEMVLWSPVTLHRDCKSLKFSVLFLFMSLYLYYFSSLASFHLSLVLLIPRFCQFMQSCSPVTSLCFCVIWAQARPSLRLSLFGHFRIPGIGIILVFSISFASCFLEFPTAVLICIVINSPKPTIPITN